MPAVASYIYYKLPEEHAISPTGRRSDWPGLRRRLIITISHGACAAAHSQDARDAAMGRQEDALKPICFFGAAAL